MPKIFTSILPSSDIAYTPLDGEDDEEESTDGDEDGDKARS